MLFGGGDWERKEVEMSASGMAHRQQKYRFERFWLIEVFGLSCVVGQGGLRGMLSHGCFVRFFVVEISQWKIKENL